MTTIRPFTRNDIPGVVALRQRCFAESAQPSIADAENYFREIFFESPWVDPELPSLVYEDVAGRIAGFSGVISRRMCFRGETIRVAVPTQFVVAPESRGLAGVQLVKRVFAGPQDLTMSDVANDSARLVWERSGATTLPMYSLHWTHVLAPVTCTVMSIPGNFYWRIVRRAARPLWHLADVAATAGQRSREREIVIGEVLDVEALVDRTRGLLDFPQENGALTGHYSASQLAWLLTHVGRKFGRDQLRVVALRDVDGGWRGWYAYAGARGATGEVVHVAARPNQYSVVIDHLIAHARSHGLVAIRGRLDPRHARDIRLVSQIDRDGPWVVVFTRRPDLLAALHRPDASLSRLDGEWWLNF